MKKYLSKFLVVLLFCIGFFALSSCDDNSTNGVNNTSSSSSSTSSATYTVIWKDGNGKTLETDKKVKYGETPKYDGATPTKKSTAQYEYTFSGWSPEIKEVTKDVTYTAQFTESLVKYTISWLNEDGSLIKTTKVEYGKMPVYDGDEPTKSPTTTYEYSFRSWYPALAAVTKDKSYKAQFNQAYRYYDISFVNEDGTSLYSIKLQAGKTISSSTLNGIKPTKENDEQYYYTFSGWSPTVGSATQDQVYTAQYTKTELPYTFHFDLNGGECDTEIKDKKTNRLDKKDFHFDLHKGEKKFRGWMYNGKIIFNSKGSLVNNIKDLKDGMTFIALYENEYRVTIEYRIYTDWPLVYKTYYELPDGLGYVTPSQSYAEHSNVELFQIAGDGYDFYRWIHDSNYYSGDTYTFGLWESDVTVIASFKTAPYTLKVTTNNSLGKVQIKDGTVTSTINQSITYQSNVSLYAIPNDGSSFVGWYSGGNLVSTDLNYKFTMPYYNYTLEARFE